MSGRIDLHLPARLSDLRLRLRFALGPALVLGFLVTGCASNSKAFLISEVSPGIFIGCKPRTEVQFEALRAAGVRTVLNLETLPWDIWPECRQARAHGLLYRDVPILASPLPPSEDRVGQALLALRDPKLRPIFVHCFLGEDRATFIVGLYRIYFEDWPPSAAWAEMLRTGFHVRWSLYGFTTYFWNHTHKPAWVTAVRHRLDGQPPLVERNSQ